ncbi:Ktr4p [Sugiyamaella lignohabitans]|uniref:Ktr4p n=1 Tax=Sugiyamaella lignohabitans TaxID=796027 RepID=A0A161HKC9_9ASCO|nr:Ktr4p [Sugiyamaella lignohabitans]ANB13417.1 Ktr4p [Sugiyamaella lignohabitans]
MKDITEPPDAGNFRNSGERVNATLLSLVRNEELDDLLMSMKEVEETFNKKFNYPWTFVNDKPFSRKFKEKTREATKAQINYEVIPKDHWVEPSWINKDLAEASAQYLKQQGVQYSTMESYHRMCRWNSGMFVHLPKLTEYKWYWRVEPKTHYFCDIDYDVFKYMEDHNKTYGFVINIYDSPESIQSLWPATLEFVVDHPEYVHSNSAIGWLTQTTRPDHNKIAGYSTCHFWSNFEIGDMDFWRSKPYQEYFDHLDRAGGFFYERWGDAPVHSIGLGLFLDKDKIHWFKDIGYQHIPYFNCPNSKKCKKCIPGLFSDGTRLSQENCFPQWIKHGGSIEWDE